MIAFLLHPAVPASLLVVWAVVWWDTRRTPPLLPAMDRRRAVAGDVSRGGSTATSKLETRVRRTIEAAGYRTYPQGTLLCVGRDSAGKNRFFTPDILVRRPYAVVEVDPARWHGSPGKVAEDILRNRFYAAAGLRVVRVRLAGCQALSPNDVVIPEQVFRPERHGPAVVRALGSAKMLPPSYWERHRPADRSSGLHR